MMIKKEKNSGAAYRIRTCDPIITKVERFKGLLKGSNSVCSRKFVQLTYVKHQRQGAFNLLILR